MLQEPALALHAAAVAGEGAVGSDDAVARDNDADGVGAVGQSYRPDCGGAADSFGEFGVGERGTVGDFSQRAPYLALEGGACCLHGQIVDDGEIAGEVAADFVGEPAGVLFWLEGESSLSVEALEEPEHARVVVGPIDGAEVTIVVGGEDQLPDGGIDSVEE